MKKSFLPWLLLLVLCCMTAAAAAEEYEEPEERPHAQIGTIDLRDNGIPVVYLSIDPKEYQSVLESSDHSYRAQGGSIRITIPEGYVSEYGAFDASFADRELALDYIVSAMKEDLELHRQAVAEHLDEELPRALAPVTFMDGDSVCAVVQVYLRGGLEGSRFPAAPEKEGFKFVRWADQNGKTYEPYTELDGPVTVYAEYAPVK